jgi:hypothetical protein
MTLKDSDTRCNGSCIIDWVPELHVLSHMWNVGLIQIQAISHIHVNVCRACIQKWDWKRRLREGEIKEKKTGNNEKIHHILVGI